MWDFFMQRKSIEPAGADKLVILFFFGIMVGSIIVNLIPFSWVQAMNVWSADYITAFMSKAVKYSTMFRYLLRIRDDNAVLSDEYFRIVSCNDDSIRQEASVYYSGIYWCSMGND